MLRNLPPLNAVRAFEAAARHSSFSKAGDELNVSHSSISRHVRGLEARIGVQLLAKQPRGVALTKAGAAYLRDITTALDLISEATEQLAPKQREVVRLSCEPTFAIKCLMPAFGKFKKLHPEIELRIDPSWEVVDLHAGEFDLAIRFSSSPIIGLEADIVSQAPIFPVGAPSLLTDDIDLDNPETILSIPLLAEFHGHLWEDWFHKAGLPKKLLELPGEGLKTALAIEATVAGQGLALLSLDLIGNDFQAGRLARFSNIELDYGAYKLVYKNQTLRNSAVNKFRTWLLAMTEEFRVQNVESATTSQT